jgi:flavin reductase (DIM6/NTAB) family NADH-FMN oxidoreductase RutF
MDADLRSAAFIEGMSRVASAVTVVTTDGDAGQVRRNRFVHDLRLGRYDQALTC